MYCVVKGQQTDRYVFQHHKLTFDPNHCGIQQKITTLIKHYRDRIMQGNII